MDIDHTMKNESPFKNKSKNKKLHFKIMDFSLLLVP